MSRSFLAQEGAGFWRWVDEMALAGFADSANVVMVERDRLVRNVQDAITNAVRYALVRERKRIANRLRAHRNRKRYAEHV